MFHSIFIPNCSIRSQPFRQGGKSDSPKSLAILRCVADQAFPSPSPISLSRVSTLPNFPFQILGFSKMSLRKGSRVWVEDRDLAWVTAEVLDFVGKQVKVATCSGKKVTFLTFFSSVWFLSKSRKTERSRNVAQTHFVGLLPRKLFYNFNKIMFSF